MWKRERVCEREGEGEGECEREGVRVCDRVGGRE